MNIIEPKVELTKNEADAINTVISLFQDLRNTNSDLLDLIFETDYFGNNLDNIIEDLEEILNACELEKKGTK